MRVAAAVLMLIGYSAYGEHSTAIPIGGLSSSGRPVMSPNDTAPIRRIGDSTPRGALNYTTPYLPSSYYGSGLGSITPYGTYYGGVAGTTTTGSGLGSIFPSTNSYPYSYPSYGSYGGYYGGFYGSYSGGYLGSASSLLPYPNPSIGYPYPSGPSYYPYGGGFYGNQYPSYYSTSYPSLYLSFNSGYSYPCPPGYPYAGGYQSSYPSLYGSFGGNFGSTFSYPTAYYGY